MDWELKYLLVRGGAMKNQHSLLRMVIAAVVFGLLPAEAMSQQFPVRPIRLVVGFAPGGSTDLIARMMAQRMSESFGQSVVIDNRPSGGGIIAAQLVAKSLPDGYTLIMGTSSTFGVNPSLYRNLSYDAIKDFSPIIFVSLAPNVLVVPQSLAVNSVQDLVNMAKAKPGQLNFASSGSGGAAHVAGELFKIVANINIVHVPYKGAGQSLTGLLSGQVQMSFTTIVASLPHIKSGKLKGLAVTSANRMRAVPELPTMAEAKFPEVNATSWNGMLAPAGTPRAVIARLNTEMSRILGGADLRDQLVRQGGEAVGGTPEEFGAFIRNEVEKWGKVIRAAGLSAD